MPKRKPKAPSIQRLEAAIKVALERHVAFVARLQTGYPELLGAYLAVSRAHQEVLAATIYEKGRDRGSGGTIAAATAE